MALERLIERERQAGIRYGTVLEIDARNRRVRVLQSNNLEEWASYLPSDFPDLEVDQTVAVAMTEESLFLMCRVSSALPADVVILEV